MARLITPAYGALRRLFNYNREDAMGGTDPGWDNAKRIKKNQKVRPLSKKQIAETRHKLSQIESQQDAQSSHCADHDSYVAAYPLRNKNTPCFSSFRGKGCFCDREICNEQRKQPLKEMDVPKEEKAERKTVVMTTLEGLYTLSLLTADFKQLKLQVHPDLMEQLLRLARGQANDNRFKAVRCLQFLASLDIKFECCFISECYGKCYNMPAIHDIDPEIVFEMLYHGRKLENLSTNEIRVISTVLHRCKIYCKEFFNDLDCSPEDKFERLELQVHTNLSVMRNAVETLRHYKHGATCCNNDCYPKLCSTLRDRISDVSSKMDPLYVYVHSNDSKTIVSGPRRRQVWSEFEHTRATRNAKFSIINSDDFLGLDMTRENVITDFVTKVARSFGVACCNERCQGTCQLTEVTRKRLFKDQSTLLTDDVLQGKAVEFDVPVQPSPLFWFAIILLNLS